MASCRSFQPDPQLRNGPTQPAPERTSFLAVPATLDAKEMAAFLGTALPPVVDAALPLDEGIVGDFRITILDAAEVRVSDEAHLQVKLPINLTGKVQVERRVFGQMVQTSVPINENLAPEVRFTPSIDSDYGLQLADVSLLSLNGRLRVNVLGFQINIEPFVKGELERQLQSPRLLDLLGGFSLAPILENALQGFLSGIPLPIPELEGQIIQPTLTSMAHRLRLNPEENQLELDLLVEAQVRTAPANARARRPSEKLPPLKMLERPLPTESTLFLPIQVPYTALEGPLQAEVLNKGFRVNRKNTVIPRKIKAVSYDARTLLEVDAEVQKSDGSSVPGTFFFLGDLGFSPEELEIRFENIQSGVEIDDATIRTGVRLRQNKLRRNLQARSRLSLQEPIAEVERMLENRLQENSTLLQGASFTRIRLADMQFFPQENGIEAQMEISTAIKRFPIRLSLY
ncbi:MAG: DUF4403 family protein [Nitritalea sp.]